MPPGDSGLIDSGLTYVGHATVLAQLGGVRLLTDPLLGTGILHVRRRVPPPVADNLRPLDAILISHAHHDHLDHHSLQLLAGECPVIVPQGCQAAARRAGATEVIELDQGQRWPIGEVTVEAVHAEHDGRRYPLGHAVPALGYLIEGPLNVYFAGDTDLFAGMSALAGRVDVAMVPIWGWGGRIPSGHLNPERAAQAVARIRPQIAVPIHWGTLRAWGTQRGLDPAAPVRAFAEAVGRLAPATAVLAPRPGERIALAARR